MKDLNLKDEGNWSTPVPGSQQWEDENPHCVMMKIKKK